jgi:FixJ family two-component response regulator
MQMNQSSSLDAPSESPLAFVIDDDSRVSGSITAALAEQGIRVECFQTAKSALAAFDQNQPVVIFLDVALLQSDAIDVLKGLGARRYRGVVQLMSGGNLSLLEAVQRIGVRQGVLLGLPLRKPLSRESIAKVIVSIDLRKTVACPDTAAAPMLRSSTGD